MRVSLLKLLSISFKRVRFEDDAEYFTTRYLSIAVIPHERQGVSKHRQRAVLLNSLLWIISQKTQKHRITVPLWGESIGDRFTYVYMTRIIGLQALVGPSSFIQATFEQITGQSTNKLNSLQDAPKFMNIKHFNRYRFVKLAQMTLL